MASAYRGSNTRLSRYRFERWTASSCTFASASWRRWFMETTTKASRRPNIAIRMPTNLLATSRFSSFPTELNRRRKNRWAEAVRTVIPPITSSPICHRARLLSSQRVIGPWSGPARDGSTGLGLYASRTGPTEGRSLVLDLFPEATAVHVIVDQAHRFHERIDGGRPHECPSAPFEVFAHGRCLRARPQ